MLRPAPASSAALFSLCGQFVRIQQIEQAHMEVPEQQVRHGRRQHAHALQHVVEVRLRDAGTAGQSSFGQFSPLHTRVNVRYQPVLQQFKIHGGNGGMISL
jgi:hypothetical protein